MNVDASAHLSKTGAELVDYIFGRGSVFPIAVERAMPAVFSCLSPSERGRENWLSLDATEGEIFMGAHWNTASG
jgi:hypothetical protein